MSFLLKKCVFAPLKYSIVCVSVCVCVYTFLLRPFTSPNYYNLKDLHRLPQQITTKAQEGA